jgi:hypothetical protein
VLVLSQDFNLVRLLPIAACCDSLRTLSAEVLNDMRAAAQGASGNGKALGAFHPARAVE